LFYNVNCTHSYWKS